MKNLTTEEMNVTAGAQAPDRVTLTGRVRQQVVVTSSDLGDAILELVWKRLGKPDDARCDWRTDSELNVCISNDLAWQVSTDTNMGILVDAANILKYGEPLKENKNG